MKRNKLLKTIHYALLAIVFISALFLPKFVLAENLEEICQLEKIEEQCDKLESSECRNLLEKCEEYYRKQSEEIEKDISKTGAEKKTLENKIYTLNKQIKNLNYQIYQSNLIVKDLGIQVEDTGTSIEKTSLKIEDSKEKLSNILRTIYEEDQKPIIEVLFSEDELSDFFDNLIALELLDSKSKEFLQNIKTLKLNLEQQKQSLDEEKEGLENMVKLQTYQKAESSETKKEQEYYLQITEQEYQQQLKEQQEVEAKAAEIRAKIIELIGIPIGEVPEFGELLKIAENISKVVGIRPAFLLGVISQESALGRNVGQCYVTNIQTGGGVFISTGNPVNRIMSTKNLPIFLRLTGNNFNNTPVSCWIKTCYLVGAKYLTLTYKNILIDGAGNIICPTGYAPYGFGGAMGPAQFIPRTWQLYEEKLTSLFGISNPSPWNVRDALAAASLYLSELGAYAQTRQSEINAANRYFGGSYSAYASQVMQRANCVQSFIDTDTMSQTCQNLLGLRLR